MAMAIVPILQCEVFDIQALRRYVALLQKYKLFLSFLNDKFPYASSHSDSVKILQL